MVSIDFDEGVNVFFVMLSEKTFKEYKMKAFNVLINNQKQSKYSGIIYMTITHYKSVIRNSGKLYYFKNCLLQFCCILIINRNNYGIIFWMTLMSNNSLSYNNVASTQVF